MHVHIFGLKSFLQRSTAFLLHPSVWRHSRVSGISNIEFLASPFRRDGDLITNYIAFGANAFRSEVYMNGAGVFVRAPLLPRFPPLPNSIHSSFFLLPIDEVSLLGVFRGKGERWFHLPPFSLF